MLSEREFKVLLRRSIVREADAPSFSPADLIEAGREIGLSATTVLTMLEEHRQRPKPVIKVKPVGTSLSVMRSEERLEIGTRGLGGRGPARIVMFAAIFCWAVVPLWTKLAMQRMPDIVWVSIPAWMSLPVVTFAALWLWFGRMDLNLGSDDGELVRRIGPFARREGLRLDQLRVAWNDGSGGWLRYERKKFPFVDLHHGVKRFKVMFGYSVPEQEWVISEIQAWLAENL